MPKPPLATLLDAVLFDLDGVIVDTAHLHFLAWRHVAEKNGLTLSKAQNESLKGLSRMDSLKMIYTLHGLPLPDASTLEAMATEKNHWYVDALKTLSAKDILPGVLNLLETLRTHHIKTAVASSSKNAKTILAHIGLQDAFDTIVDGWSIEKSKPDPEVFLKAAERLHARPEHTLVIEDALSGIQAARAAGMCVLGVGSHEQLGVADAVVLSLNAFHLEDFVQRFCPNKGER
ncbi:MAG: beta-phosphoglucomutase [Candidatus Carbobacillus sp.]|nr:beta-phosphoglucomutase [Candidatus Carbobacillus sp.]